MTGPRFCVGDTVTINPEELDTGGFGIRQHDRAHDLYMSEAVGLILKIDAREHPPGRLPDYLCDVLFVDGVMNQVHQEGLLLVSDLLE